VRDQARRGRRRVCGDDDADGGGESTADGDEEEGAATARAVAAVDVGGGPRPRVVLWWPRATIWSQQAPKQLARAMCWLLSQLIGEAFIPFMLKVHNKARRKDRKMDDAKIDVIIQRSTKRHVEGKAFPMDASLKRMPLTSASHNLRQLHITGK